MAKGKDLTKAITAMVVIAFAIFLIIDPYNWIRNRLTPGRTPKNTVFRCLNCKHQFEVNTEDVSRKQAENPAKDNMIKCPACNEFKALVATRCIHCKKYYLEQETYAMGYERGTCIHCGKSARNLPPPVATEEKPKPSDN